MVPIEIQNSAKDQPKPVRRLRLIPRFILVISISLIVTFGLFAFAAYMTGSGILDRFDEHQTLEISEIIEGQIRSSMLSRNPEHLTGIIEGISSAPSVSSAMLVRKDGTIIRIAPEHDSSSLPIPRILHTIRTDGEGQFTLEEGDQEYLFVTVPITRREECTECHGASSDPIAYLSVKTVRHSFGEITQGHRNANIILTGIVFIVVAIVVSLTVFFVVVRPLNRFTHDLDERVQSVAVDMAYHDLEPVRYLGSDSEEISHMVARFNELSQQLNVAKHEVEKSHRKQMESAQNLGYLGEMAAHTAHEIKNPLAGIRGSLSTISSRMPHGDPHREIIERAIRELERIYQSMMDLLTTAKGGPPAFRLMRLNTTIADIVRIIERERREKKVVFALHLDDGLPPIEADTNLISQVVWNLVSNAADAVDDGGRVVVTTRRSGSRNDMVDVIVEDNGPGIREADQESIFKPFVTGRKDGTGLGLSVVKRAVGVHGGEVHVRSTIGNGATFTVSLPIKAPTTGIRDDAS